MNACTALVPVRKIPANGLARLRQVLRQGSLDAAAIMPRVWLEALEPRRMMSAAPSGFDNHGSSTDWLPAQFNVPGFQSETWLATVARDSNGALLVAGGLGRISNATRQETSHEWFIARVKPDGAPDLTFGQVGGFEVFHAATDVSNVNVLPLPNGKFIVVGSADEDVFVARFNADGSIDTTFNGGIANYTMFLSDVFSQLAPDGSVTITGLVSADLAWNSQESLNAMVTLRLTPGGQPDLAFAPNGYVTTDLPADLLFDDGLPDLLAAVATSNSGVSIYYQDWIWQSFLTDEHPDLAFTLRHVQIDARGNIVSANEIYPDLPSESPDGSGGSGYLVLALPDGSAYVGGGIDGNRIEKLNATDHLDTTFGQNGIVTVRSQEAELQDVDATGKLILDTYDTTTFNATFVRLNTDGSVDSTFNPWSPQANIYGPDLILPEGELLVANEISPFDSKAAGFVIYTRPTDQRSADASRASDSPAPEPAVMGILNGPAASSTQPGFFAAPQGATLLDPNGDQQVFD